MHASIAKLSDSVKLLIELDEKWELSRFDIEAHAAPAPSIEFRKPLEARDAIPGADWKHSIADWHHTLSDDSHRFSAVCDGVYCWFAVPLSHSETPEKFKRCTVNFNARCPVTETAHGWRQCEKCEGHPGECKFQDTLIDEDEDDDEPKGRPAGTTECQKCEGRGRLAWPEETVCNCCHGLGYFSHL